MDKMSENLHKTSQDKAKRSMSVRHDDGFSIIEILVAIMIFSIGILGMASMQTNATGSNRGSMKLSGATEKAVTVMEELTSLTYSHPNLVAGTTTPLKTQDWIDNNDNGVVDEAGEDGDFTVSWTVLDNAMIPNTKTLSVTVTSDSSTKTVNLATVMSN